MTQQPSHPQPSMPTPEQLAQLTAQQAQDHPYLAPLQQMQQMHQMQQWQQQQAANAHHQVTDNIRDGALSTVGELTGVSWLTSGKGWFSTGGLLILGGIALALWNLKNSATLLVEGAPFWETYFLVEKTHHAIQAYGSVVLPVVGIIVMIIGLARLGHR